MNENSKNEKNIFKGKKEKTINIWIIISFMLLGMFITSLYVTIAPDDPKNLEYKWCVESFKWDSSVGNYCCTENPYNHTQNKCAYYHEGIDQIDVKGRNSSMFQGVKI